MIHPLIADAYKVLEGGALTRDEALALAEHIHEEDILDLISLANKVRRKFAPAILPCSIVNAKSGRCEQNCRFCAQSGHHHTGIETYGLMTPEALLEGARAAVANGVRSYGIVTSGYGYGRAPWGTAGAVALRFHRHPEPGVCQGLERTPRRPL